MHKNNIVFILPCISEDLMQNINKSLRQNIDGFNVESRYI
ncbi:hypothetical protein HMPREF1865_00589 [Veillonella parvula]|nr:hypothetical protein HMPREF1865_00589 [Veillonella parvula]